MNCMLVNLASGIVENIIVADPTVDAAPDGFTLISAPDWVLIGASWDGSTFRNAIPVGPVNTSGVELL